LGVVFAGSQMVSERKVIYNQINTLALKTARKFITKILKNFSKTFQFSLQNAEKNIKKVCKKLVQNHPFALHNIYDSGVGFVSFLGKIFE
jgi:hypothetical protein